MNPTPSQVMKAVAVCALLAFAVQGSTLLSATVGYRQYGSQVKDQSKDKPPSISDGEMTAAKKVYSAVDLPAKLAAAGEFVKKYPKSSLRPKVSLHVASEIEKVQDGAQRITQLESLLTVFREPVDAEVIDPILINAYFKENRPDDGFRVVAAYVAKSPNDLAVLTSASIEGSERAKKNDPKFIPQSQQYGAKAIELIESGKKPDTFDDARWSDYQTRWLPILYQSLGMLSLMTGNKPDARARLDKAVSLNPVDPFNYVLIGTILNDEYQQLAQQHKSLSAGPLKDAVLKQAQAKIDQVVDMYAHAVALSEGKPAYQQLHDQILQDLTSYYAYRHGGSSDGLQQLIDQYKK